MTRPPISRLRDALLRRGTKRSTPPPPVGASGSLKPEQLALARRVRPFAEAMYLVIGADAEVGERERDVLRGALRTLTDNMLSSTALDHMLAAFEEARAREGLEPRLDDVASELYGDRTDSELALELAIAAASVDGRLDAREQMVAHALADRLGIAAAHVDALMDDTPSPSTDQ
jgi:tellurite resistance protein